MNGKLSQSFVSNVNFDIHVNDSAWNTKYSDDSMFSRENREWRPELGSKLIAAVGTRITVQCHESCVAKKVLYTGVDKCFSSIFWKSRYRQVWAIPALHIPLDVNKCPVPSRYLHVQAVLCTLGMVHNDVMSNIGNHKIWRVVHQYFRCFPWHPMCRSQEMSCKQNEKWENMTLAAFKQCCKITFILNFAKPYALVCTQLILGTPSRITDKTWFWESIRKHRSRCH